MNIEYLGSCISPNSSLISFGNILVSSITFLINSPPGLPSIVFVMYLFKSNAFGFFNFFTEFNKLFTCITASLSNWFGLAAKAGLSFAIVLLKKFIAPSSASAVGLNLLNNFNKPLFWSSKILYVPPIQLVVLSCSIFCNSFLPFLKLTPFVLLSSIPINLTNSSLALLIPPTIACLLSAGKFVLFISFKVSSNASLFKGLFKSPSNKDLFNKDKNLSLSATLALPNNLSASG